MPKSIRSPLIVTIDTGAVKLASRAVVAAECEHESHRPLLIVSSLNDLLTIAGTEDEISAFADDLLLAIQVYQHNGKENRQCQSKH